MSEKLTTINILGSSPFQGIAEWGECSIDDMVKMVRKYSEWLRSQADAIDATRDCDFRVTLVRGSVVQHLIRVLQAGNERQP